MPMKIINLWQNSFTIGHFRRVIEMLKIISTSNKETELIT